MAGALRVLACPDKFRGTLTADQAVSIIGSAVETRPGARFRGLPMSDGGEGFLDVFAGPTRTTTVTGPLGRPVEAAWRLSGRLAVVEMARASGMDLVGGPDDNRPLDATTTGTGELIRAAVDAGARRILVGHGGSATTDGGLGALRALSPLARLRGVELVAAVDVETRFVDAAEVFGPQKGASPRQVELLRRRLERLVQVYRDEHGVDVADAAGGGAAGGLAGGLLAAGARIESGFDVAADAVDLDESIAEADLVVTGEGILDEASLEGKVVGGVVDLAEEAGAPVLVVAGQVLDEPREALRGRARVVSLSERFGLDRSLQDAAGCLREVVAEVVTDAGPR